MNDCTLTFTCVTRCPDLTHKSLWPLATSNCGGLRPRIGSPMSQECCGLRPQQTVAASGGKIPYVLKGIVTNLYILANSTLNLTPLSKFRFVIYDYELTCYTICKEEEEVLLPRKLVARILKDLTFVKI